MKKDETKELNLTFPEDYSNTDLAGADVVFTVTVNHVYEETDAVLDDAFVAARNIDGVSTVAEYRQYVYDNLMSSAKSQQETELERNVLEAVTANATFKETPEEMVSRYYDRLVKNLTATASMYGIDLRPLCHTATVWLRMNMKTSFRNLHKAQQSRLWLCRRSQKKKV